VTEAVVRRAGDADLPAIARLRRELTVEQDGDRYARQHHLARVVLSPSERSIPFYQRAGFGPADILMVWTPPGPDG